MHISYRQSTPLSSFCPAFSKLWWGGRRHETFSKSLTAHLSWHAPLVFIIKRQWPFLSQGLWVQDLAQGLYPAMLRIWDMGLQLRCEACLAPGPAWALTKPLQKCSCGLHASTSTQWLKAWWGRNHRSCGSFQNCTDDKDLSVISAQRARSNSLRNWGQGVGVPGFWRLPVVTTQRRSTVASSGNFQRIQGPARTFFFYKQTVFYFLDYNYKHTCSNYGIFP